MGSQKKSPASSQPDKVCQRCGRAFSWRAKWRNTWESVKYCSDACRRHRLTAQDEALEQSILALLASRARGATLCPSEPARQVLPAQEALGAAGMEQTRRAARRLVEQGKIEIVQGGQVVDPSRAKGPIRLRLVR